MLRNVETVVFWGTNLNHSANCCPADALRLDASGVFGSLWVSGVFGVWRIISHNIHALKFREELM